jgi:lysophospholipase L1-like esterase
MKRRLPLGLIALLAFSPLGRGQIAPPNKWEAEIKKFEVADRAHPPPADAVVFVGSSSIRFWKLADSFPGMATINRGFGGSFMADSARYADRIVTPYRPRAVAVYAGDNDLAAGQSPEQVRDAYREFVGKVHAKLPSVPIIYISIKPSPSRWRLADKIRTTNRLIAEAQKGDANQKFVDVFTPMLGPDGKPRAELFRDDRLHMNERGYKLWAEMMGPVLKQ